jgi:hypothetical protein
VKPVDRFRWLLITSGGLGCSPFAPGTVGTLGGVLLAVTLQWSLPEHTLLGWGIAAAVLFLWGATPVRPLGKPANGVRRRRAQELPESVSWEG